MTNVSRHERNHHSPAQHERRRKATRRGHPPAGCGRRARVRAGATRGRAGAARAGWERGSRCRPEGGGARPQAGDSGHALGLAQLTCPGVSTLVTQRGCPRPPSPPTGAPLPGPCSVSPQRPGAPTVRTVLLAGWPPASPRRGGTAAGAGPSRPASRCLWPIGVPGTQDMLRTLLLSVRWPVSTGGAGGPQQERSQAVGSSPGKGPRAGLAAEPGPRFACAGSSALRMPFPLPTAPRPSQLAAG